MQTQSQLRKKCWPAARFGEALQALCRRAKLGSTPAESIRTPEWLTDGEVESIGRWLPAVTASIGVETVPVETSHAEAATFVAACAPAILRLEFEDEALFLAIAGGRGSAVSILTPELEMVRESSAEIRRALCRPLEEPLEEEIEQFVSHAGIDPRRRRRAAAAILRERLQPARLRGCWLLRAPAGGSIWEQARGAGLPGRLAVYLGVSAADYLLSIACWIVVGSAALQGRVDPAWLLAWAILLLTRAPLETLGNWTQGVIAIRGGGILKRRLLAGSLRLRPEEVRAEGAGHFLGRVIESEALESLALSGGLGTLAAMLQIAIAVFILAFPAGSPGLAVMLVVWAGIAGALVWRNFRKREQWTSERIGITNDFVERMVGHRTRIIQERPHRWHSGEDEALERYLQRGRALDGSLVPIVAVMPRAWLIASLLMWAKDFVTGSLSPEELAVRLGAVLLAQTALQSLSEGFSYLAGAAIAWRQVKLLFQAAARQEPAGLPEFSMTQVRVPVGGGAPLMELRDLAFRYAGRSDRVLNGCYLRIARGDRILLEGQSGGGKSTLAALLAGLREPEAGLILLRGLDLRTLGAAQWRHAVACAPQFHENHVFCGTMAFNLLMGRSWPPCNDDLEEATAICEELGLGNLLARMPAGIQQTIGETGWQLSYGERTRLFLARALLQGAEVVILDESFGALDPQTLQQAADCVRRRASTLVMIAHP